MVEKPLVVFFNDRRKDRISVPSDFKELISWIERRQELISERARQRIFAHRAWIVYKDGERGRALRSIRAAAISGSILPLESALFILRCFLPRNSVRIYHRLKSILPKRGIIAVRRFLSDVK